MFKHDLLQVMSVAVTLLVDVRMHRCPSLISCISRVGTQPPSATTLPTSAAAMHWVRLTERMYYVYKQRLKNKTKQANKETNKPGQDPSPTPVLAHIIFPLPGSHWPRRPGVTQCSRGGSTGSIQSQPIAKPFWIWLDRQ